MLIDRKPADFLPNYILHARLLFLEPSDFLIDSNVLSSVTSQSVEEIFTEPNLFSLEWAMNSDIWRKLHDD